jgi:azurin
MINSNTLFKCILFLCIFSVFTSNAANIQDSVIIKINVNAGLQFDIVRFNIKPGAKVKIIFANTDDMDHNFLITKPGAREEVVMAALQLGEKGPSLSYIPKSDKVLWAIPVISPHQEQSISFTAPMETGVYPYVCTYPGHGFLMFGAMYVSNDKNLPDITKDVNIPEIRRVAQVKKGAAKPTKHAGHHMKKPLHPYTPVAPYLYRVFIEGAGPAAIAVNLPQDLSYCWDAGSCSMRFAWKGDFLDNTDLWKGKGDALAKVTGKIFFRDKNIFPFRVKDGQTLPRKEYKGYQLINRFPEFHYTLNGKDVYELVKPKEDGSGLVRHFRIPKAEKLTWFIADDQDRVAYEASAGTWENGKLKLSAEQAANFSITMTIKKEGKNL